MTDLRTWIRLGAPALAAVALVFVGLPATGQDTGDDEPPLPTDVAVEVDAIESNVVRIGIPDLIGPNPYASEAGGILRNDFTLMPGYRVIGPRSIRHDTNAEGLSIDPGNWGSLQASGVIKGRIARDGSQLEVQLKYFRVSGAGRAAVEKTYSGSPRQLRSWMHDFGNEVLEQLTGTAGPFGTRITYAKRVGPGRKDVYCADMDGHGALRVSDASGIAMLPSFGPGGHIWYTRLTEGGMFITRAGTRNERIITGNGLTMAPSVCGDRVFFVSSRDGNSEIYSARKDGRDVRRLTNHPAIDVSPTCGPGGKVAFVSARHGTPQIWMMDADGSNQRRITFKGNHNQTPAFCPDPRKPILAFTGRDDGTLDIFTVNYRTNEYTRVTQGQGMNKDPAFSPDCRILAFTSDRRGQPGIYLASPSGFNQHRVVEGVSETVDWARP